MNLKRKIFTALSESAPFQPATNFWRAIELAQIIETKCLVQNNQNPIPNPRNILDLGCGDGALTNIIRNFTNCQNDNWIGIDRDQAEIDLAKKIEIYSNLHVGCTSQIPEEDKKFDIVFSNSVLEHIPDILSTLKESSRVLKVGGKFIATVPSEQFHACLKKNRKKDQYSYLKAIDKRLQHFNYFSPQDWEKVLSPLNLKIEIITPYLSSKEVKIWERISNSTAGMLQKVLRTQDYPIDIQRRFDLRNPSYFTRKIIPKLYIPIILPFLSDSATEQDLFGCYLVQAVKTK